MFTTTLLLAATALTGLVSAQNYSTSGPISITPDSVDYNTRLAWCRAQTNSCPQICGGQASPNNCSAVDLTYTCTCTNGMSPNISNYDQTIPAFECAQWKADCVQAHPNDLDGQTGCLSVTCGSLNASSGESTASSSSSASMSASSTASSTAGAAGGAASSSASATSSGSSGGSSASPSASSSSSGAAASASAKSAAVAMSIGQSYGTGLLGAALLAVFGLAL